LLPHYNRQADEITTKPAAPKNWLRRVVAVIVILVVAERVHEHVQSEATRQRLIGRWTHEVVRDGGKVDTWLDLRIPF